MTFIFLSFVFLTLYCDETERAVRNSCQVNSVALEIYMHGFQPSIFFVISIFVFPSHLVILLKYSFQSIKIRR